jgi:hypothetical protein
MKYYSNDQLFLDCYIKRYKAYIESAVYINELLENLNVLVNYLYETLYSDYPKNPKFSIYRLMIIIWHREVTTPLTDLKNEKNFLNIILKTFKRFLTVEINKVYGCDIRTNRAKSDPPHNWGNCNSLKNENEKEKYLLIVECQSDDGELFINQYDNHAGLNYASLFSNNNLNCGLGNNFCITDSKTSILEDVYTFDFQAKYFLEQ